MKMFITIVLGLILSLNTNCQPVHKIMAKEAFTIIDNMDSTNTILIDGRSAGMFAEKHIKGAINIDAFEDTLELKLKKYINKKEIIVYCTNHRRAEIIIEKLKEMQYQGKIIFITDGIKGWISAELSTVST